MATTITYTAAQCVTKITALRAELEELQSLPRAGRVGKSSLDLTGKIPDIEGQIEVWRLRLQQSRNGGIAPPMRRIC